MTAEFDSYAANYDAELNKGLSLSGEDKSYFARGRVAWLARRVAQHQVRVQSVLDFGCGTGGTTPLLAEALHVDSAVGVDVSPVSIEAARRTFANDQVCYSLRGDFLPAQEVDLAYCNGVFHHVPRAERGAELAWISDALRPGGLFAFWENNPWNPGTRWIMSRVAFDRDAIVIYPGEAKRLLRSAGFQVLSVDFCFVFPRIVAALRIVEPWICRWPFGGQYLVLCRKRKGYRESRRGAGALVQLNSALSVRSTYAPPAGVQSD